MAKSAGNFQRVTELADRGLDPLAFRYLVLTSRYSRKLEYSDRSLDAAAAALGSLRAGLRALGTRPTDGPWAAPPPRCGRALPATGRPASRRVPPAMAPRPIGRRSRSRDRATAPAAPLSDGGRALHDRFVAAIDDDLDMPVALALLREILRAPLPGRRAALAHPRCRRGPRAGSPPRLGDGHGRGRGRRRPGRDQALLADARTPPAPSATRRAPMRSVTSSRRPAGTSSTVPRAAD